MKITPTPPSPVEGEGIMPLHHDVSTVREGAFSYKPPCPGRAQRRMKMLHVIPDSVVNPGRHSGEGLNKDWIASPGSGSGTGYPSWLSIFI